MVLVEGGWFDMGSNDGRDDEQPIHRVFLDSFYIDKYQVTNKQYAEFLNAYGSDSVKHGKYVGKCMIYWYEWGIEKTWGKWQSAIGYENHPVVGVTWYGANEYARYYGIRLPTEAEWEYAARGGQMYRGCLYSGSDDTDDVSWYNKNSLGKTHPVGQKHPNELGLFDMSGNVSEYCEDWYNKNYYKQSPEKNPTGPESGNERVLRGGSWDDLYKKCTLSYRDYTIPGLTIKSIGFRCVKDF